MSYEMILHSLYRVVQAGEDMGQLPSVKLGTALSGMVTIFEKQKAQFHEAKNT